MLEKIREGSQGVIAKSILGLVIITFALAGIGNYLGNSSAAPAAIVNGDEIARTDFDERFERERQFREQQFGAAYAQLFADEASQLRMKSDVLDALIDEQLQLQLAEKIGLRVSDQSIKEFLREQQQFQTAGQFDNELYRNFLARNRMQATTLRDRLRVDQVRTQIRMAVATTDFSLPSEVNEFTQLDKQTRDVEYIVFKQDDQKANVTITDEEKSAYYDEHQANYQTQEKISLQYVEIKMEDLMKEVAVSDEQLETYYNENRDAYRKSAERRRASVIQFNVEEDRDAAQAKAEAVLAKVKAGEDFAELAKTESDDAFSGEQGGDLDWFERGVYGDEFDKVVFELANVGDVSEIFETEAGLYIAKLTGDEGETFQTFEEAKADVAESFKRLEAGDVFAEKQQGLIDAAFEDPESLESAAAAADTVVKETALFTRAGAPVAVNFPEVLQAAFSVEVLQDNVNSELIEINGDHVMAVRLLKHEPQRIQSQEEVADRITEALTREKSQETGQS